MKRGGTLIAGIVAASLIAAPGVTAKTFEVTRTGDTTPNGCGQGGCTLREAVIAANTRDGADVVELRPGRSYGLQLAGSGEDASLTGDLDVLGGLTIRSSGRKPATVDANGIDRTLHALASRLTLSRVVVTGANSEGIWAQEAEVSLTRSVVRGAAGDGVLQTGVGSVKARRTSVRGNAGHGIDELSAGGVQLDRVRISKNGDAGVQESSEGNVVLAGSVVERNEGAGVFVNPPGSIRVTRSTIAGNEQRGLLLIGVGGAVIKGSTVSGNHDGGISFNGSTARIVNSTLAGNTTDSDGGGILAFGVSDIRLNAVTVARNVADMDGSGDAGGGLRQSNLATFTVGNSLIALNRTAMDGLGPDCFQVLPFESRGQNLLTDDDDCVGFDGPGDIVRANPRIGPLKRNGGSTETVALKRRSPAIGKAGNDAPGKDQRGRKRDKRPDIGAFER